MLSASSPHTPQRRERLKAMDVYQEAVDYLLSQQIPVEVNTGSDMLEEDVFSEDSVACLLSPLQTGSFNFPDSPTLRSPEELLEKRLEVLKRILESEELYLNELDILLMPLKALRASAGTSQPVLSSQDVQTVFYQVPELRDLHQCFYEGLRARLEAHTHAEPGPGPGSTTHSDMGPPENSCPGRETGSGDGFRVGHGGFELTVGDLYLKMVSQICVYRGFIDNYEKAVEIVRNCTKCDARFRILAQSMMSKNGRDKVKLKYTFEALLYKPLEKITKTTLVLHELLKTTPEEHNDYPLLQEVLRLSHGFLSGVNEGSQCKREVTLRRGMRRQLMRDGFVVDECEGVRNLRHLFLYTDLLLCAKLKAAAKGKHSQYRFCWYMPLANLRVNWRTDPRRPPDTQLRLLGIRSKMHLLRQQLRPHMASGGGSKRVRQLDRSRKKLEQMELLLLTHSPVHRLDLHSPSGKSHSFLLSSLYELEEWRETIHKLTRDNVEMIPPDLLTLTNSCVKLRMTQQPPLNSSNTGSDEQTLCGTLTVAIHCAYGLQQPACVYVCVEVDGYDFYEREAQTHSSVQSLRPCWNQDFSFQVDGAQNLRVVCVRQAESGEGGEDMILGKASVKLQATDLSKRWRKQTLSLGQVEVMVSLKFCPHPLESPSSTPTQQLPVFSVPVEVVAHQEGVLVPHVVRWCAEEVERRGMEEVGIYRLSGAATDIITLKTAFDSNLRDAVSRLRGAEVNAVSGVLKLYFRELPEPLIPAALFQSLATALDIQDEDSRLDSMLCLLRSCPPVNRHTFLYLMHHLQRISTKAAVNKMSLMNLGTVFGPSLVRPPVVSLGHCGPVMDISQEVVLQARVVQFFLECKCLPAAQTSLLHNTDSEDEDETTHL